MQTSEVVLHSLESSDSVHSILKDSTKFKRSTMYRKIFISPDRTPEERVKNTMNWYVK